jgi:hypothetical protein
MYQIKEVREVVSPSQGMKPTFHTISLKGINDVKDIP